MFFHTKKHNDKCQLIEDTKNNAKGGFFKTLFGRKKKGKQYEDDVATDGTEYDLETFLDAYKPLCQNNKKNSTKNLKQFNKKYYSEVQLTNNPLSHIRREKKFSQHIKMTDNKNGDTNFKRRDSGYSSHSSYAQHEFQDGSNASYNQQQQMSNNNPQMTQSKKTKNVGKNNPVSKNEITNDERTEEKLNNDHMKEHENNSKLKHIKKKLKKQQKTETKDNEQNKNVWKRAKTRANKIKTRFSKPSLKVEGDSPLIVNTPKIQPSKKRGRQTDKGFPSRQNSFKRNSFRRNSYTGKKRVKELRFEDNFTVPGLASKRDCNRQTVRRRPRSLYENSDANLTIQFPVEEPVTHGIFDEKYLNKSCQNLYFENDDSSVADVFLDDDDASFEAFNEINFDQFNLDHEDKENDDVSRIDVVRDDVFDDIQDSVENEVEKYYEATERSEHRFYLKSTAI